MRIATSFRAAKLLFRANKRLVAADAARVGGSKALMAKYFLTGAAKGVTDSVRRVSTMMKDRPIPDGKPKPKDAVRKDFGKRSIPRS
jgi:hypothetical protein